MADDPKRMIRLREDELSPVLSQGMEASVSRGALRFLGQVFNGGAKPSSNDKVYLVHPVTLDGPEQEGASVTAAIDASRTIPVVMIGSSLPQPGDLVVAFAVGGRWLAETSAPARLACSPCAIPRQNLTLSWTNVRQGNGSIPLVFTAPARWTTACQDQMNYSLACAGGLIQFGATYYFSGSCPGGQGQSCVSPGKDPLNLVLDMATCDPFYLHYSVTDAGCTVLWNKGFTGYTITV